MLLCVQTCGEPWRAQILILNYPSCNRSCWTGQTGWAGAQWVELLGKYVLVCLCSANSFLLAQAEPRALWGVMGKGRREKLSSSQNRVLGACPEREFMVVLPVKGWIRPRAASLAAPSSAQEFPALALEFSLNKINGKVSELLYDGSMSPGGIAAIPSRAGNWGFGESLLSYW